MDDAAAEAAALLKALANQDRLLILCHLADGEKNVSELQELLGLRQPTISQQLSRLRYEKLVDCRRSGKTIYYRLSSDEAGKLIALLYELYCAPRGARRSRKKSRKSKSVAARALTA
ncbi:MAG: metalloregulator ArsR/SmtB family transcription factor [Gammaproteobacteria bacterium]|jgi:ArsR family transcriptional regulator|nr:metalloregulator ArsR/SmtB family transcription factor [Gammaproteobacteria bacterium]NCF81446.1 metalloregulator ArsR/SmtB family transcription factor [Pseudomonadota bacterium]